jgi:hypothetical protein
MQTAVLAICTPLGFDNLSDLAAHRVGSLSILSYSPLISCGCGTLTDEMSANAGGPL